MAGDRVGDDGVGLTRLGEDGAVGLALRPGMTCTGATGCGEVREGVLRLGVGEVRAGVREGVVGAAGWIDLVGVLPDEPEGIRVMPPRSGRLRVVTLGRLVVTGVLCGVGVVNSRRVGAVGTERLAVAEPRELAGTFNEGRIGAVELRGSRRSERAGAALSVRVLGRVDFGASQDTVRVVAW